MVSFVRDLDRILRHSYNYEVLSLTVIIMHVSEASMSVATSLLISFVKILYHNDQHIPKNLNIYLSSVGKRK